MPQHFDIRLANVSDAAVIGWQRAHMFQEMGLVPEPLFDSYRVKCEASLRAQLSSGEYVGWLASPKHLKEKLVAGAGCSCGAFFHIRSANREVQLPSLKVGTPSSSTFSPNRIGDGMGWPRF